MNDEPIFIAGPDRSGTTLLYALLASHPRISMVRRTNYWRWFYGRYGDIGRPDNFERCFADLLRYKRLQRLLVDPERIQREFWQDNPGYGRLFALLHKHNAERVGKPRWGDKSLHTEHYAGTVFKEFPHAKIIHMTRDPRDRYTSVRKRFGKDTPRLGASTGRWLYSMQRARRNLYRFPNNYRVITYEALAANTEETLRNICEFIGETYDPAMLAMDGAAEYRDSGGNSSFEQIKPGVISTNSIGRFRKVLSSSEIVFIQMIAGQTMKEFGYEPAPVRLPTTELFSFYGMKLPIQWLRMHGWMTVSTINRMRGVRVPASRMVD